MYETFLAQILEISHDLSGETQYVGTFCDDAQVRASAEHMISSAYAAARDNARRAGGDPEAAALQAGLMLMTFGFYLGREHARRGYPAPMGPSAADSGLVPDTPAGLE